MDALWNVEDKLNISTHQAVTALVCTAILAIVLCTVTILMVVKSKKLARSNTQILSYDTSSMDGQSESWFITKKNDLRGPGCWSGARKWDGIDDVVMRSKNCWLRFSESNKLPVWQRPILMGEKCQLPRFSGLILYDEQGRPLPHRHNRVHSADMGSYNQVEAEVVGETLLKDLLLTLC